MFFKYLDFLSPNISIYYKGTLTHPSIVSGIFSILALIIVINLGVYFSIDLIRRENPNAYYFNSFIEDAGTYKLNNTSMFHFLSNANIYRAKWYYFDFDFRIYNIIGIRGNVDNYITVIKNDGLFYTEHWLYGYCNKEIHGKELNELIENYEYFEKSVCIKKYYDKKEKKYYDIGDEQFVWPSIENGTYNEENGLYGIYIQKCENSIINNILENTTCKSDTEIENYFVEKGTLVFNLLFLNNNINIINYQNPYKSYFFKIPILYKKNIYSLTEINISPAKVRTYNGLVTDTYKDDISYIYDDKMQSTFDNTNNNLYLAYTFYLENVMHFYERRYKKIQDVISDIGGFYQIISIIAIFINKIYNNYIMLVDTEELLNSLINAEKKNLKRDSLKYIFKRKKNKFDDKKKKNSINSNDKTKDEIKKNRSENDMNKNNSSYFNIKNKIKKEESYILSKSELEKLENLKRTKMEDNFLSYLIYKIPFNKKRYNFQIYENFRLKILSEEHIMRNHLNIYNLLKVTEKKRICIKANYELHKLINLI